MNINISAARTLLYAATQREYGSQCPSRGTPRTHERARLCACLCPYGRDGDLTACARLEEDGYQNLRSACARHAVDGYEDTFANGRPGRQNSGGNVPYPAPGYGQRQKRARRCVCLRPYAKYTRFDVRPDGLCPPRRGRVSKPVLGLCSPRSGRV